MVKAKFKVNRIECSTGSQKVKDAEGNYVKEGTNSWVKTEPCELRTIVLTPVYGNDNSKHENSVFWDYTPSGEIKLGTVNPAAWQEFELDKEYIIDFSKAN
jgi:hypothetical protein